MLLNYFKPQGTGFLVSLPFSPGVTAVFLLADHEFLNPLVNCQCVCVCTVAFQCPRSARLLLAQLLPFIGLIYRFIPWHSELCNVATPLSYTNRACSTASLAVCFTVFAGVCAKTSYCSVLSHLPPQIWKSEYLSIFKQRRLPVTRCLHSRGHQLCPITSSLLATPRL